MRPFGTSTQLARRRARALGLLRRGQSPKQVAQRLSVTAHSVRRWHRASTQPHGLQGGRGPGAPCRLTTSQLRRLVRALKREPATYGYAANYWNLVRIARLIGDLFHVHYRPSGVWYLLRRLQWSSQQPQRRALHRDDQAIAHWKRYVWPHIKKVAGAGRHPCFS
jgi:transposase